MPHKTVLKAVVFGSVAGGILLGVYFAVLSLVSGWSFAKDQFFTFWYFILGLAVGFGIQVGFYSYLRALTRHGVGTGAVAVSGTTSAAAMISCCAHYLTNILPVLGVAGIASFLGQYQIEFFWVGLVFNLAGIAYIGNRLWKFKQGMA